MKRWLPAILWMMAIFIVSHQPSTQLPHFGLLDLLVKKAAHFLAYALLALLVQRAWWPGQKSWGWALLITAVYAISDEIHQSFVPGRFSSVADIFIDASGGLSALLLSHWYIHHGPRRKPAKQYLLPVEAQSGQTTPTDRP